MSDKRVVCLNCMDGRAQLPVISWIKENSGADFVDMVTEPGIDGILANPSQDIGSILHKINISIDKNNAESIFIAGHYDCKGNPVSNDDHLKHIKLAIERIQGEVPNKKVTGLWINENWKVEKVD